MRRTLATGGVLVGAFLVLGTTVATAPRPAAGPPPPSWPGPYGLGGKISLRPPGAWQQTTGPVDWRALFARLGALGLPLFGPDISVSGGDSANEVTIAADPTRSLYFVAGANAPGGAAHYTTTDGGRTWTRGVFAGIGDPAVAYDGAGNAYFAQLSSGNCPDPVLVYRSPDGGVTWRTPVQALSDALPGDHFVDKEWLAADTWPGSPYYGRVYVSATSFYAPGCNVGAYINDRIVLAYSTDQGSTWSAPVTVNDASHDQNQFSNPVVAPDGTVYLGFQYQNCTYNCAGVPAYNQITRSTDGGVTWSPSITITGAPISTTGASLAGYQYLYANSTDLGFRHNDQVILGVAPTDPRTVYALWTDGRWDSTFGYQGVTGRHADIAFSHSADGGATWSAPIRVNDDPPGNGKDQFFPWMTVGSDGTIHVTWMDRRDDPAGFQYRQYYSQSTDGGRTWTPNQPVADAGAAPSSFIGDYNGIAVNRDNTLVLPIWTDMRNGQQAYTDRGQLAPGPTATPCPLAFSDVQPADYFYIPVQYLTCRGIISGYSDGTFRPANTASRAQLVKIVVGAFGVPANTPPPADRTFRDVPADHPFYAAIEAAAHAGIVSGYACGTRPDEPCPGLYFRPYANVTRGQLTKIVAIAGRWTLTNPPAPTFHDVPAESPFYPYIEAAACRGVISGYADGTFRPGANATRGQTAKIVYNALTAAASCVPAGR